VPERQEPDLLQQQISSEHPVSSRVFDRPLDRGERTFERVPRLADDDLA
jgi:hypothetical protein